MDEAKFRRAQDLLITSLAGLDCGECSAILCDALIFVVTQAGIPKDKFLAQVSEHWDSRLAQAKEGIDRYDS